MRPEKTVVTVQLDIETARLLTMLAKKFDDNRSMAVRDAIRRAAGAR